MSEDSLSSISKRAEKFVAELFENQLPLERYFHNFAHTNNVVKQVNLLADLAAVEPGDKNVLMIAAWFHDTGYVATGEGHEKESAKIAYRFLTTTDLNNEFKDQVEKLIMATRIPTAPISLTEKIICDADLQHLASRAYPLWSKFLKQETEHFESRIIPADLWRAKNIAFFENHHYYSDVAQGLWNHKKQGNYEMLLNPALEDNLWE